MSMLADSIMGILCPSGQCKTEQDDGREGGGPRQSAPQLCQVRLAADARWAPLPTGKHCRLPQTVSFDPRKDSGSPAKHLHFMELPVMP